MHGIWQSIFSWWSLVFLFKWLSGVFQSSLSQFSYYRLFLHWRFLHISHMWTNLTEYSLRLQSENEYSKWFWTKNHNKYFAISEVWEHSTGTIMLTMPFIRRLIPIWPECSVEWLRELFIWNINAVPSISLDQRYINWTISSYSRLLFTSFIVFYFV